jgi:hypothetical protein
MGFQVAGVQQIGKIETRRLWFLPKKNLGDPVVDHFDSGFTEAEHFLQIVFCGLGHGEHDGRCFSHLFHEKSACLHPDGRLEKVGKLEVDQVMNCDIKRLRDKKRIDIVGRKITIIPVLSGFPWDLHMLSEVIIFGGDFNHRRPWDIEIAGSLQMNSATFNIWVFRNALEEVPDIDADAIILDLSRIKQDFHNETP